MTNEQIESEQQVEQHEEAPKAEEKPRVELKIEKVSLKTGLRGGIHDADRDSPTQA